MRIFESYCGRLLFQVPRLCINRPHSSTGSVNNVDMRDNESEHIVNGFSIRVTPWKDEDMIATAEECGNTVRLTVHGDGTLGGYGVSCTVADHEQLDPRHQPSPELLAAMEEAVQERRTASSE